MIDSQTVTRYDFPFLDINPSNYPPNSKPKLQRSRRALTTIATRDLHVVGRFNNPHSPTPSRQSSFRMESCRNIFFSSMARSCVGGEVPILLLKYRRSSSTSCVSGTTVGAKMQERQVAATATATCDGDNFQETINNTCMSSVRSIYVWSSCIAEYGSTG